VSSSTCYASGACSGTLKCNSGSWVDHCSNGVQDCDETDVDCGGSCPECADMECPSCCAIGSTNCCLSCGWDFLDACGGTVIDCYTDGNWIYVDWMQYDTHYSDVLTCNMYETECVGC
jgi:hypothetical protein